MSKIEGKTKICKMDDHELSKFDLRSSHIFNFLKSFIALNFLPNGAVEEGRFKTDNLKNNKDGNRKTRFLPTAFWQPSAQTALL